MDNMNIYKKNKKTIDALNQQFNELQMQDIFEGPVRTAGNMEKTREGYDRDLYSVDRTKEDTKRIKALLMEKPAALAIKNYPPETKVVLRIRTAEVRELAEMMLPGKVR